MERFRDYFFFLAILICFAIPWAGAQQSQGYNVSPQCNPDSALVTKIVTDRYNSANNKPKDADGKPIPDADPIKDQGQILTDYLKQANCNPSVNDPNGCDTLAKDFSTAFGKFAGACTSVPLDSSSEAACAKDVASCSKKASRTGSETRSAKTHNVCINNAAELGKAQEDVKKAQAEIATQKSKISDLQEQATTKQNEANAKMTELSSKIKNADAEIQSKLAEMDAKYESSLSEQEKASRNTMVQIDGEINKATYDKKAQGVALGQAHFEKVTKPMGEFIAKCYQEAVAQAAKDRAQKIAQGANGLEDGGGQAGAFQLAGRTAAQRDQISAVNLHAACVNTLLYKQMSQASEEDYKISIKDIGTKIDADTTNISALTTQKNQIMTDASNDKSRSFRVYMTAREAAVTANRTNQANLQTEMSTAKSNSDASVAALKNKADVLQTQVADLTDYLDAKQAIAKDKETASKGQDIDKATIKTLNETFGESRGKALALSTGVDSTGGKCCDNSKFTAACTSSQKFSDAAGINLDSGIRGGNARTLSSADSSRGTVDLSNESGSGQPDDGGTDAENGVK